MKLLLDQGVPRSAAARLRAIGWDVVHTGEVDMARALDADILARADAEGRILITLDADFHALLAHSGAKQPSVVRIRIEGLRAKGVAELIHELLPSCEEELLAGAAVTVEPGRARIRRLPLP